LNAPAEHTRHILVVEDDPHLAAGVVENLRAESYRVDAVTDGRQALEWLQARTCGLVLLDVMLPEVDGFAVCRTLRERGDNTPVLFLTARGDPADRVRGLEGAVLRFGGNEVDFRAFRARSWNGFAQELTEKEAMILKVLAERPGEIVSREDLLERVWGYDVFPSTRTVDNFILRLRKRFERDPANPRHFLTVWGVGYRFMTEGGS
jgi:two-component system alkaline phosphatase synthesis response regulator PhoP